jgi:hypothetical protein
MAFFTRLILALFGMAFAVLFTLGVLCWLALYVAFACARWLVTGRKPQVVVMWQQVQAIRKGMKSGQAAQHGEAKSDAVEDAVVREIHDKRYLPKD